MKKLGLVLLAFAVPAAAFASTPSAGNSDTAAQAPQPEAAAEQTAPAERQERLICRRTELTGQRTASRRVCRTAAQWRQLDR